MQCKLKHASHNWLRSCFSHCFKFHIHVIIEPSCITSLLHMSQWRPRFSFFPFYEHPSKGWQRYSGETHVLTFHSCKARIIVMSPAEFCNRGGMNQTCAELNYSLDYFKVGAVGKMCLHSVNMRPVRLMTRLGRQGGLQIGLTATVPLPQKRHADFCQI